MLDICYAVTSLAARAVLKISLGINPNASVSLAVGAIPISVDGGGLDIHDGRMTAADALAIRKMAGHLTNAVTPRVDVRGRDTLSFGDHADQPRLGL